jgi:hypothetical protein
MQYFNEYVTALSRCDTSYVLFIIFVLIIKYCCCVILHINNGLMYPKQILYVYEWMYVCIYVYMYACMHVCMYLTVL